MMYFSFVPSSRFIALNITFAKLMTFSCKKILYIYHFLSFISLGVLPCAAGLCVFYIWRTGRSIIALNSTVWCVTTHRLLLNGKFQVKLDSILGLRVHFREMENWLKRFMLTFCREYISGLEGRSCFISDLTILSSWPENESKHIKYKIKFVDILLLNLFNLQCFRPH